MAVHVQEALSPAGHGLAAAAALALAGDPDITAWLATIPAALLPEKR